MTNASNKPDIVKSDAIVVRGARVHNLKNITARIPLHSLTVVTGVSGSGKSSFAFDTLYAEGQRRYLASLSAYARQFLDRIDRPDVDDIEGVCPALAIRQKSHSKNPRSTVGTVTEINDYLRLLFARAGVAHCPQCGKVIEKDTPQSVADFVMSLPEGRRFYICRRINLSAASDETLEDGGAARRVRNKTHVTKTPPEEKLAALLPELRRRGVMRLLIGDAAVELDDAVQALKQLQAAVAKDMGVPACSENSRRNARVPGEAGSFVINLKDEKAGDIVGVRVIVDRLTVRGDMRKRLTDSLEIASRDSEGRPEIFLLSDAPDELERFLNENHPGVRRERRTSGVLCKFSEAFECPACNVACQTPEPRLFSFNNPFGACPECQGFGNTMTLDLNRVIPNPSKSLAEGAIHPWTTPRFRNMQNILLRFAAAEDIPDNVPWNGLSEAAREIITHGKGRFPGIMGFFEYLEGKKYKMYVRIFLSRYRGYAPCLKCGGERLRAEARAVRVGEKSITEIGKMAITEAIRFFDELKLDSQRAAVAERLLGEIRRRLDLLIRVGLDYLSLDRLSSTLSGGESQRIQLATSLGSNLVGALYVLDEPSIGLHARDSRHLAAVLGNLRDLGNTVLVVEHDPEIIRAADYVIDIGPRAGESGGSVVFEGSYESLLHDSDSLTRKYLTGELKIPIPVFRCRPAERKIRLTNVRKHNLKIPEIEIPLDRFVCVTGVSGSGKSTLVHEILCPVVKSAIEGRRELPGGLGGMEGVGRLDDVILVDQSPIGRTPRSNPATYIKAFDDIRRAFAETRDAVSRGFGPGHFSFNMEAGRCPTCQGNGTVTVEMQFLADVELTCEDCDGRRFKRSILEVRYKSKNIAETLDMTVTEAISFFAGRSTLVRKLQILEEIGLGYLRIGQSSTSLSGGEAQRIKLASFIAQAGTKNTLFVFDEPTTGLHFDDIRKLLAAFDRLIAAGNSLVVIEHNLDVIKTADWIIDLGPEGGDAGGRVVCAGTPEEVAANPESHTGRELQKILS